MKLHANAALSLIQRRRMVGRAVGQGWSLAKAAEAAEVSDRTCSKWVSRYLESGEAGLLDRSSAPRQIPHRTAPERVEAIEHLRRLRMTAAEIAETLGMALSTVSAVLKRIGLGKLSRLDPPEPPNRYERRHAGELLHIDIKKLGTINGAGWRVTGQRTQPERQPPRPPPRRTRRLGIRARLRRRRNAPGLRRSPRRREGHHRRRLPALRDRVLPAPRHQRRARDDRQRRRLPLDRARRGLPGTRHPTPANSPLPPTHQRQRRALHQDHDRRLERRRDLRLKPRACDRP